MKDDVEVPTIIPKKRRALEKAPDYFLAVWLARDDITPSERRRLQTEKDRRKATILENRVGLLIGDEGMTPKARGAMTDVLRETSATLVLHTRMARGSHGALMTVVRELGAIAYVVDDRRELIQNADHVLAFPRESYIPEQKVNGVWPDVRYAKHRGVRTTIVMPNGERRAQ